MAKHIIIKDLLDKMKILLKNDKYYSFSEDYNSNNKTKSFELNCMQGLITNNDTNLKLLLSDIFEDLYCIHTFFLNLGGELINKNNIKSQKINLINMGINHIDDIYDILQKNDCGGFNFATVPIEFNSYIFFLDVTFTFIKIHKKIFMSFSFNIGSNLPHYNKFFLQHAVKKSDFIINSKLFGNSFPMNTLTNDRMPNNGFKLNDNNLRPLIRDILEEISWLDKASISAIAEASIIQVVKCKNDYIILIDSYFEDRLYPTYVFTPLGKFVSEGKTSWTNGDLSIKEFFELSLGAKFKIKLNSKINKSIFTMPVLELDWCNKDFLNIFTEYFFKYLVNK